MLAFHLLHILFRHAYVPPFGARDPHRMTEENVAGFIGV